jgi:hypothetical protein
MSLFDIRVKLDRAKEHFEAFTRQVDGYVNADPPPLHVVTWGWESNLVRDVELTRFPPTSWGAIVGDCVHNLRCVLDHVVWDLSGGNVYAPKGCEFPIFTDREKFFQVDGKGRPRTGSGQWKIRGVTEPKVREAVTQLQPFCRPHDPSAHPLAIIHDLDRLDKHRALHIVTGTYEDYVTLVQRKIREVADLPPGWHQARATQAPYWRSQVGPGRKANVKMRFDLALRVTLATSDDAAYADEEVDVLLGRLISFVESDVLWVLQNYLAWP